MRSRCMPMNGRMSVRSIICELKTRLGLERIFMKMKYVMMLLLVAVATKAQAMHLMKKLAKNSHVLLQMQKERDKQALKKDKVGSKSPWLDPQVPLGVMVWAHDALEKMGCNNVSWVRIVAFPPELRETHGNVLGLTLIDNKPEHGNTYITGVPVFLLDNAPHMVKYVVYHEMAHVAYDHPRLGQSDKEWNDPYGIRHILHMWREKQADMLAVHTLLKHGEDQTMETVLSEELKEFTGKNNRLVLSNFRDLYKQGLLEQEMKTLQEEIDKESREQRSTYGRKRPFRL